MSWKNKWFVQSSSNPNTTYTVAEDMNGDFACGCVGWTRHVPRKDCKHIREVKAGMQKLTQARAKFRQSRTPDYRLSEKVGARASRVSPARQQTYRPTPVLPEERNLPLQKISRMITLPD